MKGQRYSACLQLVSWQDTLQMLDPSGRHTWRHCTEHIGGIWIHAFPYERKHHPVARIDM